MTQTQKIIGASLVALLLVGGAAGYWYGRTPVAVEPTNEEQSQGSTTPNEQTDGGLQILGIEGLPEGARAEVVGVVNEELYKNTPKPSLNRALPQQGMSAEAYAVLVNKRAGLASEIEKNPAAMQNWLALGTVHKQANDYEGAKVYYSYVATVNPTNLAAHWSLGALYENYLKDYAKAETSFRAVIALDKNYVPAYTELYQMLVSIGQAAKAQSILNEGLSINPKALDLLVLQAKHYVQVGDITKAKSAYDAAIAEASAEGNTALVQALKTEKAAIQ